MAEAHPPALEALFVTDFETTGVPPENDPLNFDGVHVLEVCVYITDLDLDPICGYESVITPTREAVEALKVNEYVREMHKANGLIDALRDRENTVTLEQAEADIIEMLKNKTTHDPKTFGIAGSGVAAFDHPLIKAKMPNLAKWLAYYPVDFGVFRRVSRLFANGDIYNPLQASFGDMKAHRARGDVEAHLEEARRQRDAMREYKDFLSHRDEFVAWRAQGDS